jgi:hypothetical protein
MASANPPTLLWSPNKTMTPITVSRVVTDASTVSVTYKVVDEYKKVQPTGAVTLGACGVHDGAGAAQPVAGRRFLRGRNFGFGPSVYSHNSTRRP